MFFCTGRDQFTKYFLIWWTAVVTDDPSNDSTSLAGPDYVSHQS